MGRKILSVIWRYGLPLIAFVLILFLPNLTQRLFSFSLDLTLLIILLLMATAWYLGRGPGLLVAVVFEATLDYFSTAPYTTKSIVITINRMALFVGIVLFASSRRNAEKRLREQHELLQVTLASIGDAVIATDIDGKVTFVNPTAEAITGWTGAEAVGKPLPEIFPIINEDTRASVESPFAAVVEKGAVVGLANHTALINRDGKEIPVEDSGAPIKDADGKIIGVIIVFHDVSERRRVEKERARLLASEQSARAEAETAGRLKDEFLATVSHELRTPLSAILGWASMLKNGKMDEATLRNALEVIERNARAQAEIIDDILDVSRIITGKLHMESAPVELTPIINLAVETLRPAALAKSINLEVSLAGALVIGDLDRLQQIIWNLVSNALKFTPAGGRIEISLRQLASNAEIKVSDNGDGISPEFLPYVFERFRQSDASTTRERGGLGLGLSIVRHLVELHGGTVTAESPGEGKGSTFTVRLPLADKQQLTAAPLANESPTETPAAKTIPAAAAPDLNGLRVLVVDDDADTLEILDIVLKQYGATVQTAASAAAALEVFRQWKPDVLISDLGMPVEDGFSFIAKIRALAPDEGGNTPAAALTAYVAETDRLKALAAGYQIHISKPIDPATLAATVAEMGKKA